LTTVPGEPSLAAATATHRGKDGSRPLAMLRRWISIVPYVVVALTWIVPDRRIDW
jgi:hypothetical protein